MRHQARPSHTPEISGSIHSAFNQGDPNSHAAVSGDVPPKSAVFYLNFSFGIGESLLPIMSSRMNYLSQRALLHQQYIVNGSRSSIAWKDVANTLLAAISTVRYWLGGILRMDSDPERMGSTEWALNLGCHQPFFIQYSCSNIKTSRTYSTEQEQPPIPDAQGTSKNSYAPATVPQHCPIAVPHLTVSQSGPLTTP